MLLPSKNRNLFEENAAFALRAQFYLCAAQTDQKIWELYGDEDEKP